MHQGWIKSLYDHAHKPDQQSMDEFHADVMADGVAPQIFSLLKRREEWGMGVESCLELWRKSYENTMYTNLFIKNQLKQVLSRLDESEISVIPLKGVSFAEKYFGSIGARATSDIDLLIEGHSLERVIELVMSLGFTVEEPPIKGHFHCSYSKIIPQSSYPLKIEIHWNLLKEGSSRLDINEFWQEATPLGDYKYVKELSDYHTFYMICLHGWRHNLDSLKYFLDIIQLIYVMRESLDYTRLLNDARRHETWKRVTRTMSIVYREHPYLQEVVPFPLALRKTLWEAEAFKQGRRSSVKNYLDYCDYQFLSYDSSKHMITEVKNWFYELWQTKKGQNASS